MISDSFRKCLKLLTRGCKFPIKGEKAKLILVTTEFGSQPYAKDLQLEPRRQTGKGNAP